MKKLIITLLSNLLLFPAIASAESDRFVYAGTNTHIDLQNSYRYEKGIGVISIINQSDKVYVFKLYMDCNNRWYTLIGGFVDNLVVTMELSDIQPRPITKDSYFDTVVCRWLQ